MERNLNYLLPPVLWMAIIFTFSSFQTPMSSEFFLTDFLIKKTIHAIEYAFLWTLSYRALKNTTELKTRVLIIVAIAITVLYAALDEWHQTFVPSRTGRLRDVGIDTLGALIASVVVVKWLPSAPERIKAWAKQWRII